MFLLQHFFFFVANNFILNVSNVTINIFLTTYQKCNPNAHFTCWTGGECIPFEQRCDAKKDCEDYSDEKTCEQITFELDKYKKTLVARNPKGEGQLMIEVEFDVTDIVEVNEPKVKAKGKKKLRC